MFSHVMIYEKVAVCQRVGLIFVVVRFRPNRFATQRVLGHSLRATTSGAPAVTSLYAV